MDDHPIDVARESVDAFNAGDWDAFRACHAPDCVEEEYSTGRHFEGIDAMLEAAQGWKRAFPDGTGTVKGAFADGDVAILEVVWEGTNTGPMTTPTGEEMPPTGRHGSVPACVIAEIEDGKIKATRGYFDLLTILTQLGVGAPAEAGVAS